LKDRIEAIRTGRIDIECGTTTWSFTRQKLVDFSLITFVDGASLLVTDNSGIKRISDVEGKRIAVIRGTTTERALAAALAKNKNKNKIKLLINPSRLRREPTRDWCQAVGSH
jgi:ABC-type amino acid transport substrate-binding protein